WLQSASDLPLWLPLCLLAIYSGNVIAESILVVFKRLQFVVSMNVLYTAVFVLLHWLVLEGQFGLATLFEYILFLSIARLLIYIVSIVKNIAAVDKATEEHHPLGEVKKLWVHLG